MTVSLPLAEEPDAGGVHPVVVAGPLTRLSSRALHVRLRSLVRGGARDLQVELRQPHLVDPAGAGVLRLYSELLPRLGGSLTLTTPPPTGPEPGRVSGSGAPAPRRRR